jgi:hypothetical protein
VVRIEAAAGQLFVLAGGEPAAVEAAMPLLEAMGQKTFVISDAPRAANLVKLSGNFLIASMIEALGEALALVAKGGVDQRRCLEILLGTDLPGGEAERIVWNQVAGPQQRPKRSQGAELRAEADPTAFKPDSAALPRNAVAHRPADRCAPDTGR